MHKEALKIRLAQIEQAIVQHEQQLAQVNANLNVLVGGRQECLYWLSQLDNTVVSLDEFKEMIGADSVEIKDA